jgi:hypothetical protein
LVEWCFTDGVPFTDPFFGETIETCFQNPCRLLFRQQTGVDDLGRYVADHPGVPPAAFIFHMSRCGSTLVSQMLAQVPEHLVLSEPGPVDAVLRAAHYRPGVSDNDRIRWLRWIVGVLGRAHDPHQERLYVKFDAWSVLDLPIVRAAFPDVPWLFLYRDPVEVLMSHSRRLGAHVIPGALPPALVGMTPREVASLPPLEYQARVLARICEAALDHQEDQLGRFVEYAQLPQFVVTDLSDITGVRFEEADVERMLTAARHDAKNPALVFEDDRAEKQARAAPPLRAAAERWLIPLYRRLEEARARQEDRRGVSRAG